MLMMRICFWKVHNCGKIKINYEVVCSNFWRLLSAIAATPFLIWLCRYVGLRSGDAEKIHNLARPHIKVTSSYRCSSLPWSHTTITLVFRARNSRRLSCESVMRNSNSRRSSPAGRPEPEICVLLVSFYCPAGASVLQPRRPHCLIISTPQIAWDRNWGSRVILTLRPASYLVIS